MNIAAVTQEIIPVTQTIAAYAPFRQQIEEMKERNRKTVFNYADRKGNEDARSYVWNLRKSKAAVEAVRKAEKEQSLIYGRSVDAQAKELVAEIEAMIAVHQVPLDEIEAKEKARKDAILARIATIQKFQECSGHSVEEITSALAQLNALAIDDSFAEFQIEAEIQLKASIAAQEAELPIATKREAEAAELVRLRAEAIAREQAEREQRIAQEAADKARAEAEAKAAAAAQAERDASERRERDLKAVAERAEQERANAVRKAKEAADNERQRIEREAAEKAQEDARREADKKHVASVHTAIVTAFQAAGVSTAQAEAALNAIAAGRVPNVKISY